MCIRDRFPSPYGAWVSSIPVEKLLLFKTVSVPLRGMGFIAKIGAANLVKRQVSVPLRGMGFIKESISILY